VLSTRESTYVRPTVVVCRKQSVIRSFVVQLMLVSLGVPLSNAQQAGSVDAKAWAGKTVALTARPRARFMSYSAAKLSFGVFGIAAAAVQGKEIIEQNGIENPAPQLVKALFDAAQAPYGLNAASLAPLPVDATDASSVARAAHGADLVFDVRPVSSSLEPLLRQKGRYYVTQEFQFQVIDVASGRILRDGSCVRTTQSDSDLPTRDELLGDHAKGLKSVLNTQRDFCLEYFELTVLGLPPSEVRRTPDAQPH
jgi:hypothetical protein